MDVIFYLSYDTKNALIYIFGMKMLKFCQIYEMFWTSLYDITKYVKHQWFIDFN